MLSRPELVDIADDVAFATVERLLELFELGAPSLDPILAELDVRLELRFALVEVALSLSKLEHPRIDSFVRQGQGLDGPAQARSARSGRA